MIKNMLSLTTNQLTSLPVISLCISGCLVFASFPRPVQAEPLQKELLLAQRFPQLQPQVIEFNQNPQTSQNYSEPVSQYSSNTARYVVYVNSDSSTTLQQVRQIDSTAYIRQVNGIRIIQSGVFSKLANAQRRVSELQQSGITNAVISTSPNSQPIQPISSNPNPQPISSNITNNSNPDGGWNNYDNTYYDPNPNYGMGNSYDNNVLPNNVSSNNNFSSNSNSFSQLPSAYYVVIPTDVANLALLGQDIQQQIGNNATAFMRTQPRGAHIAVGSFTDRSQAEQWNNFLKNLGYGNARVYYGK